MKTQNRITQSGPFRCVIPLAVKDDLQQFTNADGIQRGVFFDTSGKVHIEHLNPHAIYDYLFITGKPVTVESECAA